MSLNDSELLKIILCPGSWWLTGKDMLGKFTCDLILFRVSHWRQKFTYSCMNKLTSVVCVRRLISFSHQISRYRSQRNFCSAENFLSNDIWYDYIWRKKISATWGASAGSWRHCDVIIRSFHGGKSCEFFSVFPTDLRIICNPKVVCYWKCLGQW